MTDHEAVRTVDAAQTAPMPARRTLPLALPIAELLASTDLEVIAGRDGLHRNVERIDVFDLETAISSVAPHEMIFLTLEGSREALDSPEIVDRLLEREAAGLGVVIPGPLSDAAQMLQRAESLALPVLRLPSGRDLERFTNDLLAVLLGQQAHRLALTERIHLALSNLVIEGHGISAICEELSAFIEAPTAIVDMDGQIRAGASLDALGLSTDSTIELLHARGFSDGGRTFTGMSMPISAGLRLHGHILAFADGAGELAVDRLSLQSAATVAALAIAKELEVQAVEDKYRSDLMHDLLFHVEDREDALRRAASFGWDIQRRLFVMVVRLDVPHEVVVPDEVTRRPALAKALRQRVLERDRAAAVVEFNQEVVILTAAFEGKHGRAAAGRFARRIVSEVSQTLGATVSSGQSRPVEDLEDIRHAYKQASEALQIGREVYGRGTVQHFLDLGTYRLLSQVGDRSELEAFAREILGELWSESMEPGSLLDTLQVLTEEKWNTAATARRVHFHYNTLRHRVTKLESILGPFMTDYRVRLDVQVALLVRSMKGLHLED